MSMKKYLKKLAALALALCLTLALAAPAGAASVTAFADVTDGSTAAAIETLRLMNVLDGYSDGSFRPAASLTRAQFCKMAIYALNAGSELGKYRATTIFPDVKPSHWAAAYINLAAKGKTIIAGFSDGYFRPGATVTYGQAVTILMRMLGYADADVGAVWPDGYIAQADTIGLTAGVRLAGSAALDRADAAKLFANLLSMNKKDGTAYDSTIATPVENVVLVSCTATATDGSAGAMQTSEGTVYKMAYKQGSGLLNGRKGTLLLDKTSKKVLTFVPDLGGLSSTIVLASAKADSLTDSSGRKYTMSSSVQMYYEGKSTTYGTVYPSLMPGMTLTLYFGSAGSVEYVFSGGSTSATAVIVPSRGSTTGFSELSGGVGGYQIYKDGVAAGAGDMRAYDVATYDATANAIRVSDTKITGYYEDCSPNASAPTSVKVLGHTFHVLTSAVESLSKFRPGDQITLLLTADNQVAGAVSATASEGAAGNAVGLAAVSGSSATVKLFSGITVSGSLYPVPADAGSLNGQLVAVSSVRANTLTIGRVSGGTSESLDVAGRKLGSTALAGNVVVYEKVNTSALTLLSLSDITTATVDSSRISYVGRNWAGQAKILVLNDVTGNCYTYGRATVTEEEDNDTLTVTYGSGLAVGPIACGYACATGSFVGIALNADGSSIASLVTLTRISAVPNSAWGGTSTVTAGGKTYAVSPNALCYSSSGSWMSLASGKGYGSVMNLYVDSHDVVRAAEVS